MVILGRSLFDLKSGTAKDIFQEKSCGARLEPQPLTSQGSL